MSRQINADDPEVRGPGRDLERPQLAVRRQRVQKHDGRRRPGTHIVEVQKWLVHHFAFEFHRPRPMPVYQLATPL